MSNVPNQQQQMNVQVRYDTTSARYANQVLLNPTAEEIYLDFSSGLLPDPVRGGAILPITTRVVMAPAAVVRLYQALGQALQRYQFVQAQPPAAAEAPAPASESSEKSEGESNS